MSKQIKEPLVCWAWRVLAILTQAGNSGVEPDRQSGDVGSTPTAAPLPPPPKSDGHGRSAS